MTATDRLSLGEGRTPVLELSAIASQCGLSELWVKAEWLNPTGSYKDRIALETIRDALRRGARGWVGTSSGNGGAAMSAYGARAGLPGFLCVAADAPPEKLQSIAPYRTTVLAMSQLGVSEMDDISKLAIEYDLKLAITAYRYNPEGMAGAEEIGHELLGQGSFTHVYVPTGGGGLLASVARGVARGTRRGPKLVCAQPDGCAPIARYLAGELREPRIDECDSAISGLQLTTPPDGLLAAAAVEDTGGWGCVVPDEAAWDAQVLLARREGIFVEPASALAVAAIMHDVRAGRLTTADRPLAVLTGTGLKDLRRFAPWAGRLDAPMTVDGLRALLASSLGQAHSP
jgi:threonine synthase